MEKATTGLVQAAEGGGNFLVPNFTFVVELIAFLIILFVLGKFVIPPINKAMAGRQAAIRKQFDDLEEARAAAKETEEKFRAQLADASHEAAKIREDAREQGAAIIADMRTQAQEESDRLLKHARSQLEAERKQAVQQLRSEVGSMATTLAEKIVGESLRDDERRDRTVERFIESLESEEAPAPTSSGVS